MRRENSEFFFLFTFLLHFVCSLVCCVSFACIYRFHMTFPHIFTASLEFFRCALVCCLRSVKAIVDLVVVVVVVVVLCAYMLQYDILYFICLNQCNAFHCRFARALSLIIFPCTAYIHIRTLSFSFSLILYPLSHSDSRLESWCQKSHPFCTQYAYMVVQSCFGNGFGQRCSSYLCQHNRTTVTIERNGLIKACGCPIKTTKVCEFVIGGGRLNIYRKEHGKCCCIFFLFVSKILEHESLNTNSIFHVFHASQSNSICIWNFHLILIKLSDSLRMLKLVFEVSHGEYCLSILRINGKTAIIHNRLIIWILLDLQKKNAETYTYSFRENTKQFLKNHSHSTTFYWKRKSNMKYTNKLLN